MLTDSVFESSNCQNQQGFRPGTRETEQVLPSPRFKSAKSRQFYSSGHTVASALAVGQWHLALLGLLQGLWQAAVHTEPRAMAPEVQDDPACVADDPARTVDHVL